MENKNTLIGTILLGLLVFGMFWFSNKDKKDQPKTEVTNAQNDQRVASTTPATADSAQSTIHTRMDSATQATELGVFATAANGVDKDYVIENELQKITIASKGGYIKSVELKKFKTWDKKPLFLFTEKSQQFSYQFFIAGNKIVNTKDLYFAPVGESFNVTGDDKKTIAFRVTTGDGQYFEQKYTLKGNDYHVGYDVNVVGMEKLMPSSNYIQLTWNSTLPNLEKTIANERRYSTLYYRFANSDVAHLDADKPNQQESIGKTDWVSFKQQFFNTTIFGKGLFSGSVKSDFNKDDKTYVKKYEAKLIMDYRPAPVTSYNMSFYFGPNHYTTLKKTGEGFENIIPLSPDNFVFNWVKYITKFAIIPTFNILDSVHLNYGIIILILTILLKLVLTPLTWKAIKSGAYMKVLKPEIDALKEKYGDDQQKISTEQMKIYSKAGVSPLGGCLPMLLQMPILFSMYYFFPNSIELRQQPFLWATDLSSYDAIITWTNAIPALGTHLSLFTVLMTITSILSAVYNQNQSGMANTQPGMQYMPYIMPVMLMFMFNDFPAALTYYYLLQNVLTVGQQWIMQKYFIDEKELLRKVEENKKNPAKKSGIMKRLEDIQKQAEAQQKASTKKK